MYIYLCNIEHILNQTYITHISLNKDEYQYWKNTNTKV